MMAGRGDELPVSAAAGRRHLPERHDQVREAQHLRPGRRLGLGALHPVRQLQLRLPAQRDPLALLRPGRLQDAPAGFASAELNAPGLPEHQLHAAGVRRGLHRLRAVRRGVPGVGGRRSGPQGDQPRAQREPLLAAERENIAFFEQLPQADRSRVDFGTVRGTQFLEPLFEFSGACAGCGETPYLKLLSQLFGDRLTVANATGCSSIYGGNLPTTPWTADADGRGPGMVQLAVRGQRRVRPRVAARRRPPHRVRASPALPSCAIRSAPELVDEILDAPQLRESELREQRERLAELERAARAARRPGGR